MNWYRTRDQNFADETPLAENPPTLTLPVLFFQAMHDAALTPALSIGMEEKVPNMTRVELQAGHWALIQASQEINAKLQEWFKNVVWGGKCTL